MLLAWRLWPKILPFSWLSTKIHTPYRAGVKEAEPDLKASQVTVKGVFEPAKLVEYVHKKTGKHAVVTKQEPEEKEDDKGGDAGKDEKKADEAGGDNAEKKEAKESGGGAEEKEKNEGGGAETAEAPPPPKVVEPLMRNDLYHFPRYPAAGGYVGYAYPYPVYPPQIFSDENPNACSVMWSEEGEKEGKKKKDADFLYE